MANTGSIANVIVNTFQTLPVGVSGQMADLVDNARIECANFCGITLGSPDFSDTYKSAVTMIAKANVLDAILIDGKGGAYSIEGLSVSNMHLATTIATMRDIAQKQMEMLGRKSQHQRVLV